LGGVSAGGAAIPAGKRGRLRSLPGPSCDLVGEVFCDRCDGLRPRGGGRRQVVGERGEDSDLAATGFDEVASGEDVGFD
jgi:hypothetical protein